MPLVDRGVLTLDEDVNLKLKSWEVPDNAFTQAEKVTARAFAGVRGLAYLSAQDVSGRGIERHGGAVSRVLFYRMETDRGRRWLMLHVTSDNFSTDYDVVDESE
jgi:hypothetical protein